MPDRSRPPRVRPGALERGLSRLAATQRRAATRRVEHTSRALQDERLRRMEQDLNELRGRVNGLIFLVAGTVITQIIVRLLA